MRSIHAWHTPEPPDCLWCGVFWVVVLVALAILAVGLCSTSFAECKHQYSFVELDDMRNALQTIIAPPGVPYNEMERDLKVERQLNTYVLQCVRAKDLLKQQENIYEMYRRTHCRKIEGGEICRS